MKKKFEVKVGAKWDLSFTIIKDTKTTQKTGAALKEKIRALIVVFTMASILATGLHGFASGDMTYFDGMLDFVRLHAAEVIKAYF